jgi:hypothetical protein
MNRIFLPIFFLLTLVTACTTPIPEVPEPVEPTETSMPTPEPTIEFVVTFDGNGCISDGPSEVLPGEYGFKFIDESDVKGELWLLYIDEGKTFQDHLDKQSEPGEWYPKESWVHYGSKASGKFEETNEGKVEISVWNLNKVREYTIMCYVDSPRNLWFVAPIFVVESLAD